MKTTRHLTFAAAAILSSIGLSVASHAQTTTTTGAPGATTGATTATTPAGATAGKPLAAPEKSFLKNSGESLYFLLQLADAAKTKAGSVAVKTLGETLNDDLNKVWADLGEIANATNEKMPTALSGGDKSGVERLNKQETEKFDRQFLTMVEKESKKLSSSFARGTKLTHPELKAVAEKWATTLKGHETEIEKAAKEASKSPK